MEMAMTMAEPSAQLVHVEWNGRTRKLLLLCLTRALVMALLHLSLLLLLVAVAAYDNGTSVGLEVDAGSQGRPIPQGLFGIFFEEINHAGGGGLWAELVSNRGFEAGGPNTPSNIAPWYLFGNESQVRLESERCSCFQRNPVALRIEVLSDPDGQVGVANPGFWGMDVRAGDKYRILFWVRSSEAIDLLVSFVAESGATLASQSLAVNASEWQRKELLLEAHGSDHNARLALTMSKKGSIWVDQVSAMPVDTYKGHGFRKELALMLEDLNPGFARFPGGCYVEGEHLRNAWRWRDTVGPWEERPGHLGDKWGYWSDDGIGFFELLLLAEDLNAAPVWVFNNGISHTDEVEPSLLEPYIKDILDGIEFARGPASSTWGRLRAEMGHPEPFKLQFVAIGNEDCGRMYYQANYLLFYKAIKEAYSDIRIISNCDGSTKPLEHPADLYDFHIYTSASTLFSMVHKFDDVPRNAPKVFVSEYAVHGKDAGQGSLLAALSEASFLIGLELNSDVVEMASYAPLLVNDHDRRWNPDAIVFNSWQQYGTPSYWVQQFFKSSNGASLLPLTMQTYNTSSLPVASALRTQSGGIIVKAVNFCEKDIEVSLKVRGLAFSSVDASASTITILSGDTLMEENSFSFPSKVSPRTSLLVNAGAEMQLMLPSYSLVAVDLRQHNSLHLDM